MDATFDRSTGTAVVQQSSPMFTAPSAHTFPAAVSSWVLRAVRRIITSMAWYPQEVHAAWAAASDAQVNMSEPGSQYLSLKPVEVRLQRGGGYGVRV